MDDIIDAAPRMREADVLEVRASAGCTPVEALVRSMMASENAWCVTVEGRPEILFGVVRLSLFPSAGCPWLLGTDVITRRPHLFFALGNEVIALLGAKYSMLRNAVDDRNEAAKRWLRRMGFTLHEPRPMGWEGRPFRLFERRF